MVASKKRIGVFRSQDANLATELKAEDFLDFGIKFNFFQVVLLNRYNSKIQEIIMKMRSSLHHQAAKL